MATDKLHVIGWLLVSILVSGLCKNITGRPLHVPLAVVHKLLAVLCLILLLFRIVGTLRIFTAPPALPVAIVVFAVAYIAAFVTGAIQSTPACASFFWLNLHRIASAIAATACAVAARLIATTARP